MSDDQIRLVIPAEPEYGRIARITASSLALRLGFGFGEIEDLRLAIDETIILLLRPEGGAGTIALTFTVVPDGLVVDAETTAGDGQTWHDDAAEHRFAALVGDTVDEHAIADGGHQVRLVKRRR